VDTIYWHVKSNLSGVYSITSAFIIQDPRIPILIPVIPDPTKNRRPLLNWHTVSSATQYTIMVDNDANFSSPLVTLTINDTFFTPLSNLPVGYVYWKVRSDLLTQYSVADTFYIQPDSIPFLYAFNGAEIFDRRPDFMWQPVAGATTYRIVIDTNPNFSTPAVSLDIGDTAFTPLSNLLYKTYYWRVSCDRNFSLFSPTDSLKIAPPVSTEGPFVLAPELSVYPNPFTAAVAFDYRVPGMRSGVLAVYDINGRLAYRAKVSGLGRVVWDAKGFPSGVYMVKAVFENKVLMKKMIMQR
jgi:hypothetical protein